MSAGSHDSPTNFNSLIWLRFSTYFFLACHYFALNIHIINRHNYKRAFICNVVVRWLVVAVFFGKEFFVKFLLCLKWWKQFFLMKSRCNAVLSDVLKIHPPLVALPKKWLQLKTFCRFKQLSLWTTSQWLDLWCQWTSNSLHLRPEDYSIGQCMKEIQLGDIESGIWMSV